MDASVSISDCDALGIDGGTCEIEMSQLDVEVTNTPVVGDYLVRDARFALAESVRTQVLFEPCVSNLCSGDFGFGLGHPDSLAMNAWWTQEDTTTGSQNIGNMTFSNESGSLAELSSVSGRITIDRSGAASALVLDVTGTDALGGSLASIDVHLSGPLARVEQDGFLLSFDVPGDWSSPQATRLTTSDIGDRTALEIEGSGYMEINSRTLSTAELGDLGQSMVVDLQLPPPANPSWAGSIGAYVTCPTAGLYNSWLGQVELTGLSDGEFHTVTFGLPTAVQTAFSVEYDDCLIQFALNVGDNYGIYYLDSLRLE